MLPEPIIPEIVVEHHGEAMTTSLAIAEGVQMDHASVIKLVRKYVEEINKFGRVGFEIRPFATAGGQQYREVAWLNEQQATLLITFMRNSEVVVAFKVALVRAFFEMRDRLRAVHAAPGLFLTGNPAHAADQLVAADRIFRGILRSSRSAGVPLAHAIRRAGEVARTRTGIDILAELDAPDPVEVGLEPEEAPDPTSAHAFYEAWRSGGVPLPFAPCFSTDFYAGYLHWSQAQGSWPTTVARFLAVVGRRHDVRKLRARYMDAAGRASILTFVVPEEERMPPDGLTQTEWLSHSARQFVQALEAWRSQPT
ncbi:Rha family transcriptional regulator [Thauera aromatica]|uniref:Rha family transcriptional regulator n=1 Tax=Thauera aromatica TaxID=59405 RepID=UPI001FFC954E|nr:Rha family transcriptional regulator [Thauera aromatica]MCK2095212.1 Rha family transcriptional regulator [Thauera aromatica]